MSNNHFIIGHELHKIHSAESGSILILATTSHCQILTFYFISQVCNIIFS